MSLAKLLHTAVEHHRAGQLVEAERLYRQIIAAAPQTADAWQLLGALDFQQGRHAEAVAHIQRALDLGSRHTGLYNNLGAALRALGRNDEAIVALRQSLDLDPRNAGAWNNLGNALKETGQLDQVQAAYQRAVELDPKLADAHDNLARLFQHQHAIDRAIHHYRQSVLYKPHNPRSHNNLGTLLLLAGQREEALRAFDTAINQQPGYARGWNNRGTALRELGRPMEAEEAFRRAIELDATLFEAANNYGEVLGVQGRADEGLAILQRVVEQAPDQAPIHSNFVMLHQYRPGVTLAELAIAHRHWAERHAPPSLAAPRVWHRSSDTARPLRLGFISADLGRHPVGCIMLPLVEYLDRSRFELWCYSNRVMYDPMQQQLRQGVHTWRDVRALSDDELTDVIRQDQIDVLFDLSGHTGHNRLGVFARRAAPVQITWAGYQSTTGIAAIDYLMTDGQMVPSGVEQHFTERVVRMPEAAWCCRIESPPVDVGQPPCVMRGHVTFGSFNNASKVSAAVVDLWAKVLTATPDSRLILKYRGFDDPGLMHYFQRLFQARGVVPERIEFRGQTSFEQMLAEYREIDVALDPFPFGGGMTSLIALWMGVPVVTLPGETIASRQTLSMLTAAGETSTVARDQNEYVRIATELAGDRERLVELRQRWRGQVSQTAFIDAHRAVPEWGNTVARLYCELRNTAE
ncbi:MAG: tetratricopeptide repeat protein [Planctomycetaceae bacterium]|nr:tetratricopeptide repeat protein [Planctomycetaceae bacterium]